MPQAQMDRGSDAIARATVGQERRRGLHSFLTWPFLLGVAFASDDLAALAQAAPVQDDGVPPHPTNELQVPHADTSLDPVSINDWDPSAPQQISQELLPGPHFPESITFGGLDAPAVIPDPENHTTLLSGGGGGGGGGEVIATGAELPADILAHPDSLLAANGLGSDGLLDLGLGLEPLSSLLGGIGKTVDALTQDLSALPVIGGLLTEPGHLISSLLGSSEPGPGAPGDEIHFSGLSLGGAVVSGGALVFGADATASAVPQLFNNGSYTDFGVATTSSAVSASDMTGLVDHLDQAAMLGDLGHGDHGATPVQLNDDHILRTPLDLIG
jgi:hypothetical protein